MWRNIFFAISLGVFTSSLSAELPNPLPDQFTVKERWFSWTSDYDIETNEYKLGHIHRKLLSWTIQYEFFDVHGVLEASAKARWFSWGITFDIQDNEENLLGTTEEKVFTFFPTFDIFSPEGKKLATAKMNFWGTRYTLRDPVTQETMVTLYRPFFRLREKWTVSIENRPLFDQKQIDPRLFIIVAAFQSDRDIWEANQIIFSKQLSVSNSDVKNADDLTLLRAQLATYEKRWEAVEPSEAEFEAVDALIEKKLKSMETSQTKQEIGKGNARIIAGLKLLMPLFDSDELTEGQKAVLYQMINEQLSK